MRLESQFLVFFDLYSTKKLGKNPVIISVNISNLYHCLVDATSGSKFFNGRGLSFRLENFSFLPGSRAPALIMYTNQLNELGIKRM